MRPRLDVQPEPRIGSDTKLQAEASRQFGVYCAPRVDPATITTVVEATTEAAEAADMIQHNRAGVGPIAQRIDCAEKGGRDG